MILRFNGVKWQDWTRHSTMVKLGHNNNKSMESPELQDELERVNRLDHSHAQYGAISDHMGDTCPTCRGTGRIPRGHEDQLVAVIPFNDIRLKPRRTKLYVCVSMAVCLLICCLIIFFLFPRSVTITPVSVLSVMVYFTPHVVQLEVTNLINISNQNFVPVDIVQFNIQGLVFRTVVGTAKISNMTSIQSRSQKSYTIAVDLAVKDPDLNTYCKSDISKVHTLFLELQMTMNISYLSHTEQLSLDTVEYIDCGTNSTIPHPVR
ncbi:transmembrane protein 106A [Myripristis murdjan]|uniref:Transmembrane protein 106A n=1 Tax=Myripristis murdjan TaxID=586833 RepID=A0A667ZMB8_9TELE|nr:transmembrane protein 106B-like [Myripristis murdjan]